MDLFDKLRAVEARRARLAGSSVPGDTVIERVLGPCEVLIDGRRTLMFGSNNYLGLTAHPAVLAAAQNALSEYGTGTTGSRIANGTFDLHTNLERDLADWFGKRHALIFSTGFQANLALIGGLCGADDVILIDRDCHASIYDATRQTSAQVIAFRHNSPESLRRRLARLPRGHRNRLVVVEGLYSIYGDVAPLRDIVDVCRTHGAYLLVDEAHSLGTFGAGGRGCVEDQGVLGEVDFVVGTFSKSLGGIGGMCVSDHPELLALRYVARAYLFTASGSAVNVAGVRAAVEVVRRHPELRDRLWGNIRQFRRGLDRLGYTIGDVESPVVPIFTGDEETTIALWQTLLASGLYVNIILPPACPQHACVLRTSCSAAHTMDQIDRAVEIFAAARPEVCSYAAMSGVTAEH